MILSLHKNNSIHHRFIVGICYFCWWLLYLLELFLLPSQPCHFPVYQDGLGSNRRLFLYIWINDILCLILVWLKGQLCFYLFFKAVSADKDSVKIMNLLWVVVVIRSSAKLTAIISAQYIKAIFVILFRFFWSFSIVVHPTLFLFFCSIYKGSLVVYFICWVFQIGRWLG